MSEPTLEMKYRILLWLGHGHQMLYGDDGEMQCSQCNPFDYKRAPLEQVEAAANLAKIQRAAEAYRQLESKKDE